MVINERVEAEEVEEEEAGEEEEEEEEAEPLDHLLLARYKTAN